MRDDILRAKSRVIDFIKDERGSEATEMVYTTAQMMIFVMCALMILVYIVEANAVHFATRRVTRNIETSGVVQMEAMRNLYISTLGDTEFLPKSERKLTVNARYKSGNKIQLKNTFEVIGDAVYRVHLIKPGVYEGFKLDLPIRVTITGMSEVYWGS